MPQRICCYKLLIWTSILLVYMKVIKCIYLVLCLTTQNTRQLDTFAFLNITMKKSNWEKCNVLFTEWWFEANVYLKIFDLWQVHTFARPPHICACIHSLFYFLRWMIPPCIVRCSLMQSKLIRSCLKYSNKTCSDYSESIKHLIGSFELFQTIKYSI